MDVRGCAWMCAAAAAAAAGRRAVKTASLFVQQKVQLLRPLQNQLVLKLLLLLSATCLRHEEHKEFCTTPSAETLVRISAER